MHYKLFISSAGTGSRLKTHTHHRNKGLLTLGLKPALAHIIDKFDKNIPIVIAVGYQKDSLIEVINEAYPNRMIEFVNVDKFKGPGSGLGYSMLCCEQSLQCPFIFIPNDTIICDELIDLDPKKHGNWVGLFDNKNKTIDPSNYRCVENSSLNKLVNILSKGIITNTVYTGLCGISDYKEFWRAMNSSEDAIEDGESYGLNKIKNKKSVFFSNWFDTGSIDTIEETFSKFSSKEHNILPKKEEAIWIFDDKCIKYHKDKEFIKDRIERMKFIPGSLMPKLVNVGENFFSYKFAEGQVLSNYSHMQIIKIFLEHMQSELWKHRNDTFTRSYDIQESFYKAKTLERVALYTERFNEADNITKINGNNVFSIMETLRKFDWEKFFEGAVWANFHGDLHGENVVVDGPNSFKLLDWRQNFGSQNYEYGDVYYDLGKIRHGLIVRHSMVAADRFEVHHTSISSATIDIETSQSFFDLQNAFDEWIVNHGYDLERVKIVTALIFLNIAALHHDPYSKFLFLLGQMKLNEVIKDV